MASEWHKRIGTVVLWIVAFVFLALDQIDRIQRVVNLVPDRYSRYLPIVYATLGVAALLLLHSAYQDDVEAAKVPDMTRLYESNVALQNRIDALDAARSARRLTQQQTDALIRRVGTGVSAIHEACLDAGWKPEAFANARRLSVAVVAIGGEPETLNYRDDFAAALRAAGLEVFQLAWQAGHNEYAEFTGNITVLEADPRNVFRPHVISALREAGLAPREASSPPVHPIGRDTYIEASAWLVVGQRL